MREGKEWNIRTGSDPSVMIAVGKSRQGGCRLETMPLSLQGSGILQCLGTNINPSWFPTISSTLCKTELLKGIFQQK
jgi:hypothetical protein